MKTQLWITEQERDLLNAALLRWRWRIDDDMPSEYPTLRIDEMLARLKKLAPQPGEQAP